MSREVVIPHSVRVTITFDLDYPQVVSAPEENSIQDVLDMVGDDVGRALEKMMPESFLATKCYAYFEEAPVFEFDISVVSI